MIDVPAFSRRIRRVELLRRLGTPVLQNYRRLTASGVVDPIFINSVPKAGTHLLASIMAQVSGIAFSGRVLFHDAIAKERSPFEGLMPSYDANTLCRELARVAGGTYGNCHLYWDETTQSLLTRPSVNAIFIVRDPRDILVSTVRYVEGFPAHPLHDHLMTTYDSEEERLTALIVGWPPSRRRRGMADLGARLRAFIRWPDALPTFRFEEFASAESEDTLRDSLRRLRSAAGLPMSVSTDELRRGIGDRWSPTMNKGLARQWPHYLTSSQLKLIDRLAGAELAALGYDD